MKGIGGLSSLEIGIAAKNAAKTTLNDVKQQVAGNYGQKNIAGGQSLPKTIDGLDKSLEKNQSGIHNQVSQQQVGLLNNLSDPKVIEQQKKDQAALATARKNLQDLEAQIKKISEERNKRWEGQVQEQEQKKLEELQVEQNKKAELPLAFKRPSTGEVGKATG